MIRKILLQSFCEFHNRRSRTFRAENVFNLVRNEFFDISATGREVLARVKVFGILHEVFADTCSQSEAEVGVDIDFADSRFSRFAELVFGNADCVFEFAAVVVDDFNILRDNGRCAVKNNRETGDLFFDFGKNVKAKFGRFKNAGFGVAGALFRREFLA